MVARLVFVAIELHGEKSSSGSGSFT
jgi:hypothetical protein